MGLTVGRLCVQAVAKASTKRIVLRARSTRCTRRWLVRTDEWPRAATAGRYGGASSPWRAAKAVASARLADCVLPRILRTWIATVAGLRCSVAAISAFVLPAAMRRSTCSSRPERPATGATAARLQRRTVPAAMALQRLRPLVEPTQAKLASVSQRGCRAMFVRARGRPLAPRCPQHRREVQRVRASHGRPPLRASKLERKLEVPLRFRPAPKRGFQQAEQPRCCAQRGGVRAEDDVALGIGQQQLHSIGARATVVEPRADLGEVGEAGDADGIVRRCRQNRRRERVEDPSCFVARTELAVQDGQARPPGGGKRVGARN